MKKKSAKILSPSENGAEAREIIDYFFQTGCQIIIKEVSDLSEELQKKYDSECIININNICGDRIVTIEYDRSKDLYRGAGYAFAKMLANMQMKHFCSCEAAFEDDPDTYPSELPRNVGESKIRYRKVYALKSTVNIAYSELEKRWYGWIEPDTRCPMYFVDVGYTVPADSVLSKVYKFDEPLFSAGYTLTDEMQCRKAIAKLIKYRDDEHTDVV